MTCLSGNRGSSMSDEFWRHYDNRRGGYLSNDDTDENAYQPWVTSSYKSGKPDKLLLVPARHVSPETWRIPYLQVILQKLNRDTGQLCLMFPTSGMKVFIEGRGLEQLDELIELRSVKSVHMFDEAIHHPVGNDAAIVTKITVEQSSI